MAGVASKRRLATTRYVFFAPHIKTSKRHGIEGITMFSGYRAIGIQVLKDKEDADENIYMVHES
jgi:hypothetical protein